MPVKAEVFRNAVYLPRRHIPIGLIRVISNPVAAADIRYIGTRQLRQSIISVNADVVNRRCPNSKLNAKNSKLHPPASGSTPHLPAAVPAALFEF